MKTLIYLALFLPALTFAKNWTINKDHSEVMFQVPYMNVSELTGRFNDFNAEIIYDQKLNRPQELTVSIKASSIDTGNKLRDGHLRGTDFFESHKYPEIIFKSKNISVLKDGTMRAVGHLSIKNMTRPETIDFTVTDSVKDTWGYENKFVKFKSKMNRKDYNINWNKTLDQEKFLVGDEVTYWGVFQIQPLDGKTPMSKHMIPDTKYLREREDLMRKEKEENSFSKKLRNLINGK